MGKQITDRQGAAEMVASAAETHAARIADGFQAIFADAAQGKEKVPDMALVTTLLARKLRRDNLALVKASDAYDRELADDAEPREARDESAAALTAEIVDIRAVLESAYGPAILTKLEIDGRTDIEPKAILSKAKKLVTALEDPSFKWPKPTRKGLKITPTEWSADLKAPISRLEKALKDVARETREAQAAQDLRDRALATNDDTFSRVARFLSAAFHLIGDDALAKKVRPSSRRPGRASDASEPDMDSPAPESAPEPPTPNE